MVRRTRFTLLAAAAFLALWGGPARAAGLAPGDYDGNGKVDVADALVALRAVAGIPPASANLANGDLAPAKVDGSFGDGKITILDVVAILRLVAGVDRQERYVAKSEDGTAGPQPPVILPVLQFHVALPRGSFGPKDPIPFLVTLRNYSDKEFAWTSPDSCEVDLKVTDAADKLVWSPTEACAEVITHNALKPGEEKSWRLVWELPADGTRGRPEGIYTVHAQLKGADLASMTNFQVAEVTDPAPIPGGGPATFDLTPGHADHFVDMTRGGEEEVVRFLRYVQVGDQSYTAVSLVPDGMRDVLLRLDAENNLIQRTHDVESIRVKLDAEPGATWEFDYGTLARATLVTRDATLRTPGGIYSGLIQVDFEVGPDAGWTEWIHPRGFWVGYTRNTIAGPVEFRLGNRDAVGFPVSPDSEYTAVLYPSYVQLNPGESYQFNLIVVDKTGTPVKVLPGPVKWTVDEALGTIDENGLFTASPNKPLDGIKGTVRAGVVLLDRTITAEGSIVVGISPIPPPPPVEPPPPLAGLVVDPVYAFVRPGGTFQFTAYYVDAAGARKPVENVRWSVEPQLGAIDSTGLFTAVAEAGEGLWGAVTAEAVVEGDMAVRAVVKVYVGTDPNGGGVDPGTPPDRTYRLQIEPRTAFPEPGQTVKFSAQLYDADGNAVPATYQWYLEDSEAKLGTVTEDGLFTAGPNRGAVGPVYVKAIVDDKVVVIDHSRVAVGEPVPPPPIDPPVPEYRLSIEPRYAYPEPGATVQFKAQLFNAAGELVDATFKWYVDPAVAAGTVTEDGLFTAAAERGKEGPVYVRAYVDGEAVAMDYAKVLVGGLPQDGGGSSPGGDPVPPPRPEERPVYLEGGSLRLSLPPVAGPMPVVQADIHGMAPDPAWAYDRTEISIEGTTVLLTPIVKRVTDGAVPAVLVPIDATVFIRGLQPGVKYTVVAVGWDTKLAEEITP